MSGFNQKEKAGEILARIHTALAIQDAQILANPKPYLERAYKELHTIYQCLIEARAALTVHQVEHDPAAPPKFVDPFVEGYERAQRATQIIEEYFL